MFSGHHRESVWNYCLPTGVGALCVAQPTMSHHLRYNAHSRSVFKVLLMQWLILFFSAIMASYGSLTPRIGRFTLFHRKCTFSQHTRSAFFVDDLQFSSALHYMLYEKASEYEVIIYVNGCKTC